MASSINQNLMQTSSFGQEFSTQQNQIKCSFCEEIFSTQDALRQHFILCGNKTDECPKCRKFIRRSHFAYHYENNCASTDDIESPPEQRRIQTPQRLLANQNQPYFREDVPSENYSPRQNIRLQSPQANLRKVALTIQCEYCRQHFVQSEIKIHRDNCLRNPANANNRQQQQQPRKLVQPNQNQGPANGIVHIPCEICNQPIDLPNWSKHIQTCREREAERLNNRARSMSREPIIDKMPCDFCQQLCDAKQLHAHERNCSRNPKNIREAGSNARQSRGRDVVLPVKFNRNNEHPSPSNIGSPRREVHYSKIDIDQTHAANRSPNYSVPQKRPGVRRSESDERILIKNDSPDDGYIDGNGGPRGSQIRGRSYENLSKQQKFGSSNRNSQSRRSSMENLQKREPNEDPSRTIIYDRPLPNNHRVRGHAIRHGTGPFVVIDNDQDTPLIQKNKKEQSWLNKFFCGANGEYD